MTEPSTSPDAAKQPGAVDETMPDPAAAAGESTADSQGGQSQADAEPTTDALSSELGEAPQSPELGEGTDINVDLTAQPPAPDLDTPATSDPDQMVTDPTDLGGVAGQGGAG